MFCVKCGTQMADNAKFCPKCGVQNHATQIQQDPHGARAVPRLSPRAKDIVVAAGTVLLVLVSFMPLFRLNVLLIGGSYSLLDLVNAYNQLDAFASNYAVNGGASVAGYASVMNGVVVWFVILAVVWVAALIASAISVACVFRKKKAGGYGLVLLGVFGILCMATVFVASSMLGEAAGSYASSVSSMIAPTSWLWVLTIGSCASFIAFYSSAKR